MKRRLKIRAFGALTAGALVVLLAAGGFYGAASAGDSAQQAYLYKLFDIDNVGADIVIAVDTSLSMKEIFPEVKKALEGFAGVLQPRDRVSVIVFDNRARRVFSGPAKARAQIKQALPDGPNAQGQRTDIGEAVSLVLKELGRPSGRLPVVIFLTDGKEEPPPGSHFAVRHDEAWAALRDRAQRQSAGDAYVHGIGLNQNTDIQVLAKVWPQAKPLTLTASDLSVYFMKLKEKIRRERLRYKVSKELKNGKVKVGLSDNDWGALKPGVFEQTVVVSSDYKKLPVYLKMSGASWTRLTSGGRRMALKAVNLPVLAGDRRPVKLAPGQTRYLKLKVDVGRAKNKLGLRSDKEYWGQVLLDISGRLSAGRLIAGLGLDPSVRIDGARQEIRFDRSIGQSIWLLGLAALAGVVFLAASGRYALAPGGRLVYRRLFSPPLFGRLTFTSAPEGERLPMPLSLAGQGRRLTIGAGGDIRLPGKGIEGVQAEMSARWVDGEPRVMVAPKDGRVRVSRSSHSSPVLITEPVALSAGSVIEIGEYRMRWI